MDLLTYVDQERGRRAVLARALGIPDQLLGQWANDVRPVPAERCPHIERATGGAVTCQELRPDVAWVRVKDKAWPHKAGRPCLDVAKAAA
jgi:DNA-binding transcriptional regulator YdaS (Cro superfamily)